MDCLLQHRYHVRQASSLYHGCHLVSWMRRLPRGDRSYDSGTSAVLLCPRSNMEPGQMRQAFGQESWPLRRVSKGASHERPYYVPTSPNMRRRATSPWQAIGATCKWSEARGLNSWSSSAFKALTRNGLVWLIIPNKLLHYLCCARSALSVANFRMPGTERCLRAAKCGREYVRGCFLKF